MVTEVKLFQTVRKLYKTMEIREHQQLNQIPSWFNFRNLFFFVSMIVMIITAAAYFLFRAKTVQEFSDTFYVALTVTTCLCCNFIAILQIANISKLISAMEKFIEKSKFITLNSKRKKCSIFLVLEKTKIKYRTRIDE